MTAKTLPDDDDVAEGRGLLKQLLAEIDAMADPTKTAMTMASPIGQAMAPYIRRDNLESVAIWLQAPGQWSGGIVLSWTPPGISNILGIPTASPVASREQAIKILRDTLDLVLKSPVATSEPTSPAGIPLEIYGSLVVLEPELCADLRETMETQPSSPPTTWPALLQDLYLSRRNGIEATRQSLDAVIEELTGTAPDEASVLDLIKKTNPVLVIATYIASASGIIRHPDNKPPPVNH